MTVTKHARVEHPSLPPSVGVLLSLHQWVSFSPSISGCPSLLPSVDVHLFLHQWVSVILSFNKYPLLPPLGNVYHSLKQWMSIFPTFSLFNAFLLLLHPPPQGHGRSTSHLPEVILNNFTTRLGHTVGRMFAALFPHDPQFKGRRAVTFHNQRDFIFFRHYRYVSVCVLCVCVCVCVFCVCVCVCACVCVCMCACVCVCVCVCKVY